jgi:hypothetical protein
MGCFVTSCRHAFQGHAGGDLDFLIPVLASSPSINPNCAVESTLKRASAMNEARGKLQISSKRTKNVSGRLACASEWRLQCERPAKEKHRQHCSKYDCRPFGCEKNRLPGT